MVAYTIDRRHNMGVFSHMPTTGGDFYPYKIDQSCRFNVDDSPKLSRTDGTGDRTSFVFSTWLKICTPISAMVLLQAGADSTANYTGAFIGTDDFLGIAAHYYY